MKNFQKTLFITGFTIGSMLLAGCQDTGGGNNYNATPVTGEPQVKVDATSASGKAGHLSVVSEPITDTTPRKITPNIDLSTQPGDTTQAVKP